MIKNNPDGPLTGDDLRLAIEVIKAHPQREYKLRLGVKQIELARAPGFTTRCLMIRRNDGELEDVSWRVALGIAPCHPLLGAAARRLISPDIIAHKKRAFAAGPVTCPIENCSLTFEDAHVDHAPPWTFDAIVDAFRNEHGEPPLKHEGTQDAFERLEDAANFKLFHDAKAQLRIIHRRANLSTLRKWVPASRRP